MPIPILETERLVLRPFTLADAEAVRALAGAAEVAATTLHIPHPYPPGAAEAWIGSHAAAAEEGTFLTWAMTRKPDGVLMGAISIGLNHAHGRGTLGYWLGVPFWSQGYTTEAARALVRYAFSELGLHRVEAQALPHNIASHRVMEKCGMRYEGTMRGYFRRGEEFVDVVWYGMVRGEQP